MARYREVYFAKLAEQAQRYLEMASHMEAIVRFPAELSLEERHLLLVAFENSVGSRRASWRLLKHMEQKERGKGNEEQAKYAREYCQKVEAELQKICDTVLGLLDSDLLAKASTCESKVFYQKMKADYYRYIAEFSDGASRSEAAEKARLAYEEASKLARKALNARHPTSLRLALNHSVLLYEVLGNTNEAITVARTSLQNTIADLENVPEESYRDSTLNMQLLRDNLTLWTSCQEASPEP